MGVQSFPTNQQWGIYQKVTPSRFQWLTMKFYRSESNCEAFILPLKHHAQFKIAGVQNISPWLATGISEEDASALVSMHSINITPIQCDIFKQVEGSKIKSLHFFTNYWCHMPVTLYLTSFNVFKNVTLYGCDVYWMHRNKCWSILFWYPCCQSWRNILNSGYFELCVVLQWQYKCFTITFGSVKFHR